VVFLRIQVFRDVMLSLGEWFLMFSEDQSAFM
jgi:hypothetical protein